MPDRVVCYTNCYGPHGVWAAVEHLPQTGLRGIELALRPHNMGGLVIPDEAVITESTPEARVAEFQGWLREHQVSVASCNIGGADLRTLQGRDVTEARLRKAREWFGVALVVSGAGVPTNPSEHAAVLSNLRYLGDAAASLGVTIALETHKGPTQNAEAMRGLMDALKHPAIGINFDTGNIAYYNAGADAAAELSRVVDLVRNIHLKDNRGGFEDWYFPALGAGGAVDFKNVKSILDSHGYTGAYTIEIEGIGGEPEASLEARHQRVADSVKHLRACGFDC